VVISSRPYSYSAHPGGRRMAETAVEADRQGVGACAYGFRALTYAMATGRAGRATPAS